MPCARASCAYEAIFNQTAIGMARLDQEGRWSDVNEAFCRMLGYSRQQLLELRVEDVTYPDDVAVSLACLADLTSGKLDHYNLEKRYLHHSGRPVWASVHVATVPAAAGRTRTFLRVH